ncbi:MAG: YczE/YyaS/YitT family protein [Acidimicrobiales bacterium]
MIGRTALDARVLSGDSVIGEMVSAVRTWLAEQTPTVVSVGKRAGRWVFGQFGTLSRISARPAARARLASAHTIRRQPMVVRVVLVPLASFFVALGVALQITSGLGVGPGDMVASGLSSATGLSFGGAAVLMSGALALAGTLLGRAPRLATLINVGMIAVLVDVFLPLVEVEGDFLTRLLHFAVGLWSVGLGIGCLLHARLGVGTHEALSLSISDRTGIPPRQVRRAQELTWIVLGVALGSQFGIGTVLVALFIAPSISAGVSTVGKALTALATAVEAPEVDAHVADVGF